MINGKGCRNNRTNIIARNEVYDFGRFEFRRNKNKFVTGRKAQTIGGIRIELVFL